MTIVVYEDVLVFHIWGNILVFSLLFVDLTLAVSININSIPLKPCRDHLSGTHGPPHNLKDV